ncbi:MAG: tryptophan--tRNA ligase [Candidatus Pacearchaeota archaeon]
MELSKDNKKLVESFGAKKLSSLKDLPDFYTFQKGLIYSHRDFDKFKKALDKGEKCAIVSGLNPSATLHLGHKVVFDTNLYFQENYDVPVFIPLSDDESYVADKVKNQEEALKNAMELAKELIAYGFKSKKTYIIIDQIYTNVYNLAFKLSKKVNYSEIKATYGYEAEENIGLHFFPAVQSAHILIPQEKFGIKNILVPIGPDEDSHIRICRDIASRAGFSKPSIVHLSYIPGVDGEKMSASKNNPIFLKDDEKTIKKKVNKAFSGGQDTIEEHKEKGGNPEIDIPCQYLAKFFLSEEESKDLFEKYRQGEYSTGDVKKMLFERLVADVTVFQDGLQKVKDSDLRKCLMKNENNFDLAFKED